MIDRTPVVLFVPVSGPQGSGEFMRCLVIAEALRAARPGVGIHFVLNRAARYADSAPFETHLIDGSPTANTPAVNAILERLQPTVVVFDNAGRAAQLRRARQLGAGLVFVSRRPGKRRKAFRPAWLRCLDQHWLAFPEAIDGPLSLPERLMWRLFPKLEIIELGAVFTESGPDRRRTLRERLGVAQAPYVLMAPGGGGAHVLGRAAAPVFADAAARVAAASGLKVVLLAGVNAVEPVAGAAGVVALPRLEHSELIDLIHDAHLVVSNGGTTLTQILAHGRACIAVPLADDQPFRVKRCARLGAVVAGTLQPERLAAAAIDLLQAPEHLRALEARAAALGVTNGVGRAVTGLLRLVEEHAARG